MVQDPKPKMNNRVYDEQISLYQIFSEIVLKKNEFGKENKFQTLFSRIHELPNG